MTKAQIRLLQGKLTRLGLYDGAIDGVAGPMTLAALPACFAAMNQLAPPDFARWGKSRRCIAAMQAYALSEAIDAGVIDGLWGPQTDFAIMALAQKVATGQVRQFNDEGPDEIRNPAGFPDETRSQAELVAFYGPAGTADGRIRPPLVRVPLPWKMKLAWAKHQTRSFLWAHEKCAESLVRVLARVDALYAPAQKTDLGLDLFGGDYAPRLMRGADRASLHSWGIAFDFDPARNRLRDNLFEARLGQPDAIPFWEAWEAEGWCSLGRVRNYDFMHVQAAHRAY
ncbi:M15 family peptidase [Pseudooceanicola algae]|uniref:Peptidoglycan binding domain protein n=1 Tax=Pseudooceanicola algae TaxID=1537215 RepID=A0A418SI79_9RHOB|nr:M15 family peptidase [Pseudooceanicola algae]QPM88963.1 hypothetical protein PSAL_001660 [Pseudooceanicola algae]